MRKTSTKLQAAIRAFEEIGWQAKDGRMTMWFRARRNEGMAYTPYKTLRRMMTGNTLFGGFVRIKLDDNDITQQPCWTIDGSALPKATRGRAIALAYLCTQAAAIWIRRRGENEAT